MAMQTSLREEILRRQQLPHTVQEALTSPGSKHLDLILEAGRSLDGSIEEKLIEGDYLTPQQKLVWAARTAEPNRTLNLRHAVTHGTPEWVAAFFAVETGPFLGEHFPRSATQPVEKAPMPKGLTQIIAEFGDDPHRFEGFKGAIPHLVKHRAEIDPELYEWACRNADSNTRLWVAVTQNWDDATVVELLNTFDDWWDYPPFTVEFETQCSTARVHRNDYVSALIGPRLENAEFIDSIVYRGMSRRVAQIVSGAHITLSVEQALTVIEAPETGIPDGWAPPNIGTALAYSANPYAHTELVEQLAKAAPPPVFGASRRRLDNGIPQLEVPPQHVEDEDQLRWLAKRGIGARGESGIRPWDKLRLAVNPEGGGFPSYITDETAVHCALIRYAHQLGVPVPEEFSDTVEPTRFELTLTQRIKPRSDQRHIRDFSWASILGDDVDAWLLFFEIPVDANELAKAAKAATGVHALT